MPPAQVEQPPLQGVGLGDLGQRLLDVALHAVRHAQEQLARFGEGHPLRAAAQEAAPQLLLQELDLAADRGLRDVQAARRLGEGALLGHGAEHLELAQVHGSPVPIPVSDARPSAIARTRYSQAASPTGAAPILHMRGGTRKTGRRRSWATDRRARRRREAAAPSRGGFQGGSRAPTAMQVRPAAPP